MRYPSDDLTEFRERRARARVDALAEVGSSSTRPSPTSETPPDDRAVALDQVHDQLVEDARAYLEALGFDVSAVRLAMSVEMAA